MISKILKIANSCSGNEFIVNLIKCTKDLYVETDKADERSHREFKQMQKHAMFNNWKIQCGKVVTFPQIDTQD